jgi:hypothetical protein
MPAKLTSAYITTVGSDRTIVLPEEIAVGTTVAIVALPLSAEQDEAARKARFAATIEAINHAAEAENASPISDEQLNELIKKATRSSTA